MAVKFAVLFVALVLGAVPAVRAYCNNPSFPDDGTEITADYGVIESTDKNCRSYFAFSSAFRASCFYFECFADGTCGSTTHQDDDNRIELFRDCNYQYCPDEVLEILRTNRGETAYCYEDDAYNPLLRLESDHSSLPMPTVHFLKVGSNSWDDIVNSITPTVWGRNVEVEATVTGDFVGTSINADIEARFTFVGFTTVGGNCNSVDHISGLSGTSWNKIVIPPFANADTYYVCASKDGRKWWQQGLSITVRDNPSSSRLGLATEAVYIKDDPQPISISSMQTGFTTYFAFVEKGGDCQTDPLYGLTHVPEGSSFDEVETHMDLIGEFDLCFTHNEGINWVKQSGASLFVRGPEPGSVLTADPSIVPADTNVQILFGGPWVMEQAAGFPDDRIRISAQTDCATNVFSNALKFPVTVNIPAGTYYVCYRTNTAEGWLLQDALRITAVEVTDDSITGVFPSVIGVGATRSLSFGGVVATPNTRVAIASDSSCSALELVVTVDTLEPILMPNPINTASPSLTVCYSLDAGNNYVVQTTAFRVIDSTSLISITPSVWGEGTTPALLFETVEPSEDSQVAFTQNMGSCTGLEAIMPVTTAGEMILAAPLAAGIWYPCYQVNDGVWNTPKVSAAVEVIGAASGSLTFEPSILVKDVTVTVVSTGYTYVPGGAMTFTTAGDPCTPGIPLEAGPSSTFTLTPTTPGVYDVCWKPGTSYVRQAAQLTVINPSASSLSWNGPAPINSFARGQTAALSWNGPELGDPKVGLAPPGYCGAVASFVGGVQSFDNGATRNFGLAAAPDAYPESYVTLAVCYSADGTTFIEQTGLTIRVAVNHGRAVTSVAPDSHPTTADAIILTATGAQATPDTFFAVSANAYNCDSLLSAPVAYAAPGAQINFGTFGAGSGMYALCYSVDGGLVYEPQVGAVLSFTSNVETTLASSVDPSVLGTNTSPDMTVTLSGAPAGTVRYAFALPGGCDMGGTRYAETVWAAGSHTLGGTILAGGEYVMCYDDDNTADFVEQILPGTRLTVAAAEDDSITALDPVAIGAGSTPDFTLAGAALIPTARFALSDDNCVADFQAETSLGGGATVALAGPILAAGAYRLCYSVDGGASYEAQTTVPTVTVFEVDGTSLVSINPTVIGTGSGVEVTLAGLTPSPTSEYAFVLSGGTCAAGPLRNLDSMLETNTVVLSDVAMGAGEYDVCFRAIPSGTWSQQSAATLTLVTPASDDITVVTPSVIGELSTPSLTFTSVTPTATTAVGFGLGSSCGSPLGIVLLPTGGSGVPTSSLAAGSYVVCYTTNYSPLGGTTWVEQTGVPDLTVVGITTTSISVVTPAVFAVGTTPVVDLVGVTETPTTRFAFARSILECGESTTRQGETAWSGGPTALASPVTSPFSTYHVCYAVSDVWYFQVNAFARVVLASPFTASALVPSTVGAGSRPLLTIQSIPATETSKFGFDVASGGDCAAPLVVTDYTASGPIRPVAPLAAGQYALCFSTDGVNFVRQSIPSLLLVVDAEVDSVTAFDSPVLGAGTNGSVVITGPPVTPLAWIGLAPSGQCNPASNHVATLPFVTPLDLPLLPAAATLAVCYSVDNGTTFVEQSLVSFEVMEPVDGDVVGIDKAALGFGVDLELTVAMARTPVPATAFLAFDTDAACSSPISPVAIDEDSLLTGTVTNGLPGGVYTLCLSYTSAAGPWVAQTSGPSFTSLVATAGEVVAVTPALFGRGVQTDITVSGATPSASTYVAFVEEAANCNIFGARLGNTLLATTGPVMLESPLATVLPNVNLTTCLSYDNGATYTAQDWGPVLIVTACEQLYDCGSCQTNNLCTWCLSSWTCGAFFNGSDCAADALVPPSESCPAIAMIDPASGDASGSTNVTVSLDRDIVSDEPLICEWVGQNTGIVETTLFVVTDTNAGACPSPERPDVADLVMSVKLTSGSRDYTPSGRVFIYYDCERGVDTDAVFDEQCMDCDAVGAECGWCFASGACSAQRSCETLFAEDCPAVVEVLPGTVSYDNPTEVAVVGTDLVGTAEAIECVFAIDGAADRLFAPASAFDPAEQTVTCTTPEADAGVRGEVSLFLNGSPMTVGSATLLFEDPTSGISGAAMGSIMAVVALLLICVAILLFLFMRQKKREVFEPPKLSHATHNEIVFGNLSLPDSAPKDFMAVVAPIIEVLCMRPYHTLFATCDATQSTEADLISKSLAVVFENRNQTMDMLQALISREVAETISEQTLFRSNSFATKIFKTYSKMHGLEYIHEAIGYTLNVNLAELADTNLDLRHADADEAAVMKFKLLNLCQAVLHSILQSEGSVPASFRLLFTHVKACMADKFPISIQDLAQVVVDDINTRVGEAIETFDLSQEHMDSMTAVREQITMDLASIAAALPDLQGSVVDLEAVTAMLMDRVVRMRESFEDLEGTLDPDSAAARRLLATYANKQNTIAVGGFFFLRFLVPALTAPEAYSLVREPPTPEQRRTLILVGKVLQNLSNGQRFGAKESYMEQLNTFIETNGPRIYQFFDEVCVADNVELEDPFEVNDEYYRAACWRIYDHIRTNYNEVVGNMNRMLDLAVADGDNAAAQSIRQTIMVLDHSMSNVNNDVDGLSSRSQSGVFGSLRGSFKSQSMLGTDDVPLSNF